MENKYSKEHLEEICELGDIHSHEEQMHRQMSALSVFPVEINIEEKKGRFLGSHDQIYETDGSGCTCKDFILRQLPCKHMYRLAHECGFFKLSSNTNDDHFNHLSVIATLSHDLRRTFVDMVYFTFHGLENAKKDINFANNEKDLIKSKRIFEKRKVLNVGEEHILGWEVAHLKELEQKGLIRLHLGENDSDSVQARLICVEDSGFMEQILKMYSKKLIPIFRHYITQNTLELLDKLTKNASIGSNKSIRRSAKLFRAHDAEETNLWAFCVPRCFNDALDIRLSQNTLNSVSYAIWTQGINFSFQKNDIVYDTPKESKSWDDFLKIMSTCLHIEHATPAAPSRKEKVGNSNKQTVVEVFPGSVTFRVMRPNSTKTKLEHVETKTVTQHQFVRILINGL